MGNPVLERIVSERDDLYEKIDEVLANVEADGRTPSEAEDGMISRYRSQLEQLEPQVVKMVELEELRANSKDAHDVLSRAVGAKPRPNDDTLPPAEPMALYRTAGAYIVDHLRARGGMRDHSKGVLTPDMGALERMSTWLKRALDNQTTTDTPGLLPEPIVGGVLAQKSAVQPFISSIGGAKPMGGIPGKTFTRPKITTHAEVGVQTTEKSELPSTKMVVGSISFTKTTRGGAIDISRQDIDWTVPSAWDILLSDLAAVYGEDVENVVADHFVTTAVATPIAVSANTLAGWATALYTAAAQVYGATTPARLPNRIWMSLDVWAQAAPIIDVALIGAGAMLTELMGSQGATGFGGNMFSVPRVVVPAFPADTCIVGVDTAYEVYEEVIGVLTAVEPSLLGVQVAYGGYIAYNAVEPEALAELTPPA